MTRLTITDIVLDILRAADKPLRIKDIWMSKRTGSLASTALALKRLEAEGEAVRERRFDQDGDEIASHWRLKRKS